jgi:hypothetical protein
MLPLAFVSPDRTHVGGPAEVSQAPVELSCNWIKEIWSPDRSDAKAAIATGGETVAR